MPVPIGYVPPIQGPGEGVPHSRYLERRVQRHDQDVDDHTARITALEKQSRATNRQTNNLARGTKVTVEGGNVPMPALTGAVLRGTGPGALKKPFWSYEWQGIMPEYWVSLDPAGASYYVSGMVGSGTVYEEQAKALLPPVEFDGGGLTMLPIDVGNYGDTTDGLAGAQAPIHLYVDVNPSFDGEEFTIYVPAADNVRGPTSPFYTFELDNIGSFDAVVHIEDSKLFYEGTLTPVMGDLDAWTIEPGFQAAWFVKNVKGWGATATPSVYWDGFTASFTDAYYQTNVYTP